MKGRIISLGYLILCFYSLKSQSFFETQAVVDFTSVYKNNASVSFWKYPQIGLFTNNYYTTKNLWTQFIGFGIPKCYGSFTGSFEHLGIVGNQSLCLSLGYAKAFFKCWAVGLQFNYHWHSFGRIYGQHHGFTFDISSFLKIGKSFKIGFQLKNPAHFKFAKNNHFTYFYPLIFTLGFSYSFSDKIILCADIHKNIAFPFEFYIGGKLCLARFLSLDLFIEIPEFEPIIKVRLNLKQWESALSLKYHAVLGFSSQITLIYQFKKNYKYGNT